MTTPKVSAPELVESQADKEEDHNEGLRRVESGAGLYRVVDRNLTAPPGACADGATYIVSGPSPTGAWVGHDWDLAVAVGVNAANGWYFIEPEDGVFAWVQDEDTLLRYSLSTSPANWEAYSPGLGSSTLNDLSDVDTSGVSDGYILVYEDSPAGWRAVPRRLGAFWYDQIACSDEETALETGTLTTWRQIGAVVVDEVRASLTTAEPDGQLVVDIKEGGVSILSTLIVIDQGAKTSVGSSPQPVISDNVLADNAELSVELVSIGGSSPIQATGLKVQMIGRRLAP
jgi:hypothetical protein